MGAGAVLVVMCGLPGTGKTTLADDLGRRLRWPVLAVDPVEAALAHAGTEPAAAALAAYVVVGAIADQLLRLELDVVVDAVNDTPEVREQWREVARWHHLEPLWVEVICSDPETHRRRVEEHRDSRGELEPRWRDLEKRRTTLTDWLDDRLVVDSCDAHEANVQLVSERIEQARGTRGT